MALLDALEQRESFENRMAEALPMTTHDPLRTDLK
jgi:hypothetical protein